eukprot:3907773-Amphidinium_carterae.1
MHSFFAKTYGAFKMLSLLVFGKDRVYIWRSSQSRLPSNHETSDTTKDIQRANLTLGSQALMLLSAHVHYTEDVAPPQLLEQPAICPAPSVNNIATTSKV